MKPRSSLIAEIGRRCSWASDESPLPNEKPEEYVQRLAELKALAVSLNADETVLGADTTVVIGGEMMGKPADAADVKEEVKAA